MKSGIKKSVLCLCAVAMIGLHVAAQEAMPVDTLTYEYTPKEWKRIVRDMPDGFFATSEARRIADNVLAYQRNTGGWPKNVPVHQPLEDGLEAVLKDKHKRNDSTTDNDATILELTYLARMYRQCPDKRYKDAFERGIEYLLDGQYDNGGWPQFWPENRGYQVNITYNDNAMVQTLFIIRDLKDGKAPFEKLVSKKLHDRLEKAYAKGIECILNTQIVVDGEPTVWCQQHDPVTLQPAAARAFELASFCSSESVQLVKLLMEIPHPDDRVKAAVCGAMKWFYQHKLTGIRKERFTDGQGKSDVRVVADAEADPIWARFYDLENCEPLFCDRDGVPRKSLAEIGQERRAGYSWYNYAPASLKQPFEVWKQKNGLL